VPRAAPAEQGIAPADLAPILRKVSRRLIPFLFLLYVFAYLDRVNVGFAAAGMERSLGFGSEVYGAGAGIFFLGYALFEVPSNLLLLRVGPRRWIGGLMTAWGLLSTATLFIANAQQFYAARFLLGVAEAGFFPGVILYLTFWFPARERARAIARFMTATAVAGLVGSPISALLLRLHGILHLHGWQWLFLAEGIPSILFGLLAMRVLTEAPDQATWLSPEERAELQRSLLADAPQSGAHHAASLRDAFTSKAVWVLCAIYFCFSLALYTLSLWLPLLVAALRRFPLFGTSGDLRIGILSSLPYLAAVLTMTGIARHSDRSGERRLHLAAALLLAAAGYALSALTTNPLLSLAGLCLVGIGIWGSMGSFWALPSQMLDGNARAGGIALINSIGALGGFAGPVMLGWLRQHQGGFRQGLLTAAAFPLLGAILTSALPSGAKRAL
jgi:ACS family tartrate transporter-like MFS transporter